MRNFLLSIFRRPHYQSDATDLILQLKAAKPVLEQRQLAGRALLWDKSLDRNEQSEFKAGRVEQNVVDHLAVARGEAEMDRRRCVELRQPIRIDAG